MSSNFQLLFNTFLKTGQLSEHSAMLCAHIQLEYPQDWKVLQNNLHRLEATWLNKLARELELTDWEPGQSCLIMREQICNYLRNHTNPQSHLIQELPNYAVAILHWIWSNRISSWKVVCQSRKAPHFSVINEAIIRLKINGTAAISTRHDLIEALRKQIQQHIDAFPKRATPPLSPDSPAEPTPVCPATPQPTANMKDYSSTPIARPTLIYGEDVSTMTEARCMQLIKQNNEDVKSLQALGVDSARITQRIADIGAVNSEVLRRLDSFVVAAPTPAA